MRADRLMWLCTDGKAAALVTQRGIRISGATIEEAVDLEWTTIGFPIEVSKCVFKGPIIFRNSTMIALGLPGTEIQGLNGDGMSVKKNVSLQNGFRAHEQVRLAGAKIDGDLDCDGGQFTNGKGPAPATFDAPALDANSAKIQGSVFLRKGFKALGRVDLAAATIGGDLACNGGQFLTGED